jgi:hypothetical protein
MNYSRWEPNPPDDRPNPSVPDPDKRDPIPGYPEPTMPPPEPRRDPSPDQSRAVSISSAIPLTITSRR